MEKTITVKKAKIREYLAEGIKITLSGSDVQNKRLVQSIIQGFIHQRRRAAEEMSDKSYASLLLSSLNHIEKRFNLIKSYNYWRHCLEVSNAAPLIEQTLPSDKGNHRRIRLTMLGLIDRCREVSRVSHDTYYKSLTA